MYLLYFVQKERRDVQFLLTTQSGYYLGPEVTEYCRVVEKTKE